MFLFQLAVGQNHYKIPVCFIPVAFNGALLYINTLSEETKPL